MPYSLFQWVFKFAGINSDISCVTRRMLNHLYNNVKVFYHKSKSFSSRGTGSRWKLWSSWEYFINNKMENCADLTRIEECKNSSAGVTCNNSALNVFHCARATWPYCWFSSKWIQIAETCHLSHRMTPTLPLCCHSKSFIDTHIHTKDPKNCKRQLFSYLFQRLSCVAIMLCLWTADEMMSKQSSRLLPAAVG